MIDALSRDLRYGARILLRRPGLTVVAILALTLGIGANTAVFSVVNALLLRPLPFEDADRLAVLWSKDRAADRNVSVSYPDCRDWQDQSQAFEDIAARAVRLFHPRAQGDTRRPYDRAAVRIGSLKLICIKPAAFGVIHS